MKKYIYIIAAAAATLTLSCNKEIDAPESVDGAGKVTFTATAAQTKTELLDGHTVWSANDQIKVFYGNGGESVTADIKTGEGTSHATYEAAVPIGEDYYAVYPASVTSSLVGAGQLSITIPAVQDGVFGAGHIAVAKGIEKAFTFTNANSFLKITVPDGYKRIEIESVAGEPLSGPISVDLRADDPVIIPGEGVSNKVEVSSDSGLPAGDVYISVIAGVTHSGGLLLKYYDAIGLLGTFFLDKPLETEASCIHSFGEFEATGEYFATLEGAGNKTGINPDNAMDLDALKALISMPEDPDKVAALAEALNGATIHMGPGTWNFQDSLLLAFPDAAGEVVVNIEGAARSGGNNTTIITGGEAHRLLDLGANANVSFSNITFEKGRSFESRRSPILMSDDAIASFTGCVFSDCLNKKENGSGSVGGCFYANDGTTLYLEDCEFFNNWGSYSASLTANGESTIKNCHFHDNEGTAPGSALYVDNSYAECSAENCIFEDNTATTSDKGGGAIVVTAGSLTLTSCTLKNNSIANLNTDGSIKDRRRGAALRVFNHAYAKLLDCTVTGNVASWGGALNVADNATLEIQGGLYENNHVIKGGVGGAILVTETSHLIIKDAVFKGNYVDKDGTYGGAIRTENTGGSITITGTTFEGNHTDRTNDSEAFGGAISISGGSQSDVEVIIDDCLFKENYGASGGASALSYQSSSSAGNHTGFMKVSNTRFEGNYNTYNGTGANYGRHGGAVRIGHDGTSSYFDNCTFVDNYTMATNNDVVSAYGGAVTMYSDQMAYFNNCRFENNRAVRGGAISACETPATSGLFLNGCSFSGNWIGYQDGTTIFAQNIGFLCMNNCTIADDTYAASAGGNASWIYADNLATGLIISNCTLIGSARYSSSKTVDGTPTPLVKLATLANNNNYLINNIIIGEDAHYSFGLVSGDAHTVNLNCTKYGTADMEVGSIAGTYDEGHSKGDFGAIAWDANDLVWKWNGTVTGANAHQITASDFTAALNSANADFKAWLQEIECINKDQLGTSRPGSGVWMPGAYQQ